MQIFHIEYTLLYLAPTIRRTEIKSYFKHFEHIMHIELQKQF